MSRFFNNAGPNVPEDHYTLDPFGRIDWPEIQQLVCNKRYFVLHAPRQSGKTTLLMAIVNRLNAEGNYAALYVNVETAQVVRDDFKDANGVIASQLVDMAKIFLPQSWLACEGADFASVCNPTIAIRQLLSEWAKNSERPIVLMIDEIDSLVGDTLISMLRQLRDGYALRPRSFPQSVILCGVRDVRDYRIRSSQGEIISGGSCFNVKAQSLRIGNFSQDDVRALYGQYTVETGQKFDESVFPRVMTVTGGQPWLVNALALEITTKIPELKDRSLSIGVQHVDEAKERLILRKDTHLDQLADKLTEERVHRVIGPLVAGEAWSAAFQPDDVQYLVDLGLVVRRGADGLQVANEIYREVIPRELTETIELRFESKVRRSAFLLPDGRLDFRKMLAEFQQFYRENADALGHQGQYKEAMPQLLLQAWLQRVINGGGFIVRDYALGTLRVDIFVRHFYQEQGKRAEQRFVVETKMVRVKRSLETTIAEGLKQTARYADKCDPEQAHLVVIDPRELDWDDKVFVQEHKVVASSGKSGHRERTITVWCM